MSEQQNSLANLLSQILGEQVKHTAILERLAEQQILLIEALADPDGEDPDALPATYMDGSPVNE
ncbi:hypothetical protein QN400_10560 [Pseudomonas sp. RTC3]|uniref:hypothetical protein n=1 Tax=unclassified Pseudomonas TaxID=196821 RepID=UPI002AB36839|nr:MULTISPECIES: hypothetical protein [unclassified Pseudomonas]MEB0062468.1 hypothetical protein [Pseudomonas sp. RTC3]MDY7565799.1 hypothetical protein [Pseudomonas sp. 5C2]MEB0027584.1 hypothetical protein [Pseudomonas sp. MH9.2]MEB0240473.1 hypothetical protein [Pseudomonas sp. 5C2]WPX70358.1 hypothetical protein RHM55_07245 [Pseudomonas sp. MH9.2]